MYTENRLTHITYVNSTSQWMRFFADPKAVANRNEWFGTRFFNAMHLTNPVVVDLYKDPINHSEGDLAVEQRIAIPARLHCDTSVTGLLLQLRNPVTQKITQCYLPLKFNFAFTGFTDLVLDDAYTEGMPSPVPHVLFSGNVTATAREGYIDLDTRIALRTINAGHSLPKSRIMIVGVTTTTVHH